jgi:hypothetical protein
MGAQKARTLVKNHCRHATMSSVFLVRIHVWLSIAMVDVGAREGRVRGVERLSGDCSVTVSSRDYRLRIEGGDHASHSRGHPAGSNNKSKALP